MEDEEIIFQLVDWALRVQCPSMSEVERRRVAADAAADLTDDPFLTDEFMMGIADVGELPW